MSIPPTERILKRERHFFPTMEVNFSVTERTKYTDETKKKEKPLEVKVPEDFEKDKIERELANKKVNACIDRAIGKFKEIEK